MIVMKGIEIRLYPSKAQANMINKNIGAALFAYNTMLGVKKELYQRHGVSITPRWQLLKEDHPWLAEVDSRALNSAQQDMLTAYNNWFKTLKGKTKGKWGAPRFKKKSHAGSYKNTSMPTDPNKLFRNGKIFIPLLKLVNYRNDGFDITKIKKIRNLTIKRTNTNKYFCSICCDYEVPEYEHSGECIGLDLGIKDLIITSNGQKFENKKFLRNTEKKIKHLQRNYSHKTKGSKNQEKARLKLTIAHEKLSNKRKDYLQKLTTKMVKENDVICIEDLNVKGMMKNHCQAKSIADCSFSMIRSMIDYKCRWYGRQLVVIDRWFPSSQTCSCCGYKYDPIHYNNVKWNQNIRNWVCHNCRTGLDRDINAAINIKNEGLRMLDRVGTTQIQACGERSSVSEMKHSCSMKQETN